MFCSLAHILLDQVQHLPESNDLIAAHIKHFTSTQPHQETFNFLDQCTLQGAPTPWIHQRRRSGRHNRRCRPHHRRAAPCPRSGSSSSVAMHSSEHLHHHVLLLCLPLLVIFEHFHIRLRARYPRALRDDMIAHTPRLRRWLVR